MWSVALALFACSTPDGRVAADVAEGSLPVDVAEVEDRQRDAGGHEGLDAGGHEGQDVAETVPSDVPEDVVPADVAREPADVAVPTVASAGAWRQCEIVDGEWVCSGPAPVGFGDGDGSGTIGGHRRHHRPPPVHAARRTLGPDPTAIVTDWEMPTHFVGTHVVDAHVVTPHVVDPWPAAPAEARHAVRRPVQVASAGELRSSPLSTDPHGLAPGAFGSSTVVTRGGASLTMAPSGTWTAPPTISTAPSKGTGTSTVALGTPTIGKPSAPSASTPSVHAPAATVGAPSGLTPAAPAGARPLGPGSPAATAAPTAAPRG